VQVYLEPPAEAAIERPVRWLAGFANVDVAPGESRSVVVTVPRRAFDAWDTAQNRWTTVPGSYRLAVGRSARDIRLDSAVQVGIPDAD
jgi:beta-glucosidase